MAPGRLTVANAFIPITSAPRESRVFFVMSDRNGLVQQVPKHAAWAEVGVYRGDFSQKILDFAAPSVLHLVDNWRYALDEHNPHSDAPENFRGFEGRIHWQHFGD